MNLVCLDFSENNLLAEQMNINSLFDLSVMNHTLFELQLKSISDLNSDTVYVLAQFNKIHNTIFKVECVDNNSILKALLELNKAQSVLLFRNDVYFENDFLQYEKLVVEDEILAFNNDIGECYAVITSVKRLIKFLNKNISLSHLITEAEKFADVFISPEGYKNILLNVAQYKALLRDILNNKTVFKPPYIAEGVFTDNFLCKGDFSIIPPVYLGGKIQIENGATVGPNSVIYNNVLISENTEIKNSIVFEDVYISSGCYLDDTVCCVNSSIKRNAALFSGSIVGENALIGEDMMVGNNSVIQSGVRYDNNVEYRGYGDFYNDFFSVTPDKALVLGSGVGIALKKPKIIIASDGSHRALIIKLAFLSGLMSTGAECIDIGKALKSELKFSCCFLECSYSVFICCKYGENKIALYDASGAEMKQTEKINILSVCKKNRDLSLNVKCKNVRQINGLKRLFTREIISVFSDNLSFDVEVDCANSDLKNTLDEILSKIRSCECNEEKYYININETEKVSVCFEDKNYNEKILRKMVHFYLENKGYNNRLQNTYFEKLWKKDSIFLTMLVVYIINDSQKNIVELVDALPDFFIVSTNVDKQINSGELARKISYFDNVNFKNDKLDILSEDGRIRVLLKNNKNKLKVLCASESSGVSQDLCDFFTRLITD